ncbi:MAG: hypothetical protein NZ988_04525 [Thaumarchaeota archaeon]|nr:hypothetical protein [Candidatus Calditenuaceae archaeon]MDW8187293.1 hypothetical protein [Nitrososphaerota archaeon]
MKLREILDPVALAQSFTSGPRFKRAFAIFVFSTALVATAGVVNTVFLTNWVYPFSTFKEISLPFTSPRDVAFASIGYLVIGTVVVMFTLAAITYATGRRGFSAELVSTVLHATVFMAIASAVVLGYGLVSEQRTFYVVGVAVEGFKAENVTYSGILLPSGEPISGSALITRAERLEMKADPSDIESLKNGSYLERLLLKNVTVRVNRTIIELGDLQLSSISYELMSYESLESFDVVPVANREPVSAILTVVGWVSMIVHSCWSLKVRVRAGRPWALGAVVVVCAVMMLLGIL